MADFVENDVEETLEEGTDVETGVETVETEGVVGSEADANADVDTTAELRAQLVTLQRTIDALQAQIAGKQSEPELPAETFVSEESFADTIDNPQKFNALLNDLFKKAVLTAEQRIMTTMPGVVSQQFAVHQTLKQYVDDFYAKNPDLKPYMKLVGATYDSLAAKHPDYTFEKLAAEAARQVRATLKLSKQPAKGLPATGKQAVTSKKLTPAEMKRKEISAMLQAVV